MNCTKELVDKHGMSKYSISKKVKVSWNTVSFWYKGIFKPEEHRNEKLKKILSEKILNERKE